MPFSSRLFVFFLGIIIGFFVVRLIFSDDKISKIKKGYTDYFKGHDKVINYLAKQVCLSKDLDLLTEIDIDTIYFKNLIRSSEIDILSRKPCFEYLVIPKNNQIILNFTIKKCDKELYVDELNFK
tara:strand:+ start:1601 stop:1975 length:375 start_codon:yes stop_codon:yes gene_type:complete